MAIALALGIFAPSEGKAQQASASSTQQDAAVSAGGESGGQNGGQATFQDNAGHDFTSPEDLFQLRYRYKTAPGPGSVKGTIRTVTTNTLYLRSDFTYDLDSRWKVVFRTDLPFVAKDPISSDHPSGDYLHGVGDAAFQVALIEQIDQQWAAGGGLRIIAPTGADNITSGKWQIMPTVGARTTLPELSAGSYFEPLLRYVVSVAGDPTKKHISNLQLDPMLKIGLPDRWFLILYPSADIRVNYGAPITGQTGRLFLPFDFSVGRSLTKYFTVSLEIGVPIIKNYPVYNFKTNRVAHYEVLRRRSARAHRWFQIICCTVSWTRRTITTPGCELHVRHWDRRMNVRRNDCGPPPSPNVASAQVHKSGAGCVTSRRISSSPAAYGEVRRSSQPTGCDSRPEFRKIQDMARAIIHQSCASTPSAQIATPGDDVRWLGLINSSSSCLTGMTPPHAFRRYRVRNNFFLQWLPG